MPIMRKSASCGPTLICTGHPTRALRRSSARSRTAPRGRARFTFTSFGDQATPTLGKKYKPPEGVTIASPPYVNDNLGSPAAADTVLGVERLQSLFHLLNGDLCYANMAEDRVRTWWDFWENNSRSARKRPWMPAAGNHENELGNGPIGYQAYQTYFSLPEAAGFTDVTRGLWYAFTVGSLRVISLANDDVAYPDGGNSYVRGYSEGAQKAWLEKELAAARGDHDVDSILVCMHQVAISTVDKFNGADLGSASNGCRCSTNTASTSWCVDTSTTTNAHIRSAAGKRTRVPAD
jgi:3',5'-cyclic AMP phosphodiesterase CpdA